MPDKRAKGGHTRAEKLSPERRSEIASKAAKARWGVPRVESMAAIAKRKRPRKTVASFGTIVEEDGTITIVVGTEESDRYIDLSVSFGWAAWLHGLLGDDLANVRRKKRQEREDTK